MEIFLPYVHSFGDQPQPARRPTILGAPTRTEFYRAKETDIPGAGAISPGAQFEFTRNGVVTGILVKSDTARPATFDVNLQITKNGREHIFTDGFEDRRVHLCCLAACFDPWLNCFIPVDQGEIWKFDVENGQAEAEDEVDYSLVVRVERFLEKPSHIPAYLTETVFYVAREDTAIEPGAAAGAAYEWDFLRDGIVTGLRACTNTSVTQQALLSGIELDYLIEGQVHLSNAKQTISPLDAHEVSTLSQPWMPLWYPVNQHEKWQIFARNEGAVSRKFETLARAEEVRVPWKRW